MKFNIVTIFPDLFKTPLQYGLLGQSLKKKLNEVNLVDLRQFAELPHRHVDDKPFGGGDGMVMMAEPLAKAIQSLDSAAENKLVVYLSPQGEKLNHALVQDLSKYQEITLICGRYGGVDQRFINEFVDREISIGDYVLNGGEFAALVLVDAVARIQPEVVGNPESILKDSFSDGLLEGPSFTRPQEFLGLEIPEVFLSGNHGKIDQLRKALSFYYTKTRRSDLLESKDKKNWMESVKTLTELSDEELKSCGVVREHLNSPWIENG